jgi:hypothetical protein
VNVTLPAELPPEIVACEYAFHDIPRSVLENIWDAEPDTRNVYGMVGAIDNEWNVDPPPIPRDSNLEGCARECNVNNTRSEKKYDKNFIDFYRKMMEY